MSISAAPSSPSKRAPPATAPSTTRSRRGGNRGPDCAVIAPARTHEVTHEAVSDFRGAGAAARRVHPAVRHHLYVGLLDPHRSRRGGEAVRGVRQDAAIPVSYTHLTLPTIYSV